MQGEPFAWDGSAGSALDELDIYDPAVAAELGLVEANLKAAQRFHAALDISRRPSHVRYFSFAGTRQTTATHVILRSKGETLEAEKIEQEDGGDGTVPTWSGSS